MKRWVLALLALSACTADPSAPTTIRDVQALLADTRQPLCDLDLSALDVDLSSPSPEWADLLDMEAVADNGSGASLEQAYRRGALRRVMMAELGRGQERVRAPYSDYREIGVPNPSLDAHLDKVRYWQEQLGLLIEQLDKMDGAQGVGSAERDPAFNLRFCVINERGGADRAQARQAALDMWEDWPPGDRIEALSAGLYLARFIMPDGGAYTRTWLAKLAQDDTLTSEERAVLALERRRDNKIVPSDPTNVATFYAQREREIAASLGYIETQAWDLLGDELRARVSLDQSTRGLRRFESHFDTPVFGEQADPDYNLWTLTTRIDAANTKRLKDLLETRDWVRDDRDGKGAAHSAWLLAQHADRDPEFQREVLSRMEAAIGQPGVSASDYAYLWDRVARADGKPQRYATQGGCQPDGQWEPHALEDPDSIDAIRMTVGLGPLEDYIAVFDCPKPAAP